MVRWLVTIEAVERVVEVAVFASCGAAAWDAALRDAAVRFGVLEEQVSRGRVVRAG